VTERVGRGKEEVRGRGEGESEREEKGQVRDRRIESEEDKGQ